MGDHAAFLVICVMITLLTVGANQREEQQSRAYFILFAHDIDSPSFPDTACSGVYCGLYNSFIVQPLNINKTHIEKLKGLRTDCDVKVLAYFDTIHIPIVSGCAKGHSMGDRAGKTCSVYGQCTTKGTYLELLREVFPAKFGVRKLPGNETVCTYPGLASFNAFGASVNALVKALTTIVHTAGFDGVYLDNRLSPAIYEREPIMQLLKSDSNSYDINGDGIPDTFDQALSQYTAYAPALSIVLSVQMQRSSATAPARFRILR